MFLQNLYRCMVVIALLSCRRELKRMWPVLQNKVPAAEHPEYPVLSVDPVNIVYENTFRFAQKAQ